MVMAVTISLDRDRGLDPGAGLVDAGNPLGQPLVEGIGLDDVGIFVHERNIGHLAAVCMVAAVKTSPLQDLALKGQIGQFFRLDIAQCRTVRWRL
jgi:hypothetical protein